MQFLLRKILILTSLSSLLSSVSLAMPSPTYSFCDPKLRQQTRQALHKIYASDKEPIPDAMPERIRYFSQLFLDKPYTLTALGEGLPGKFDQAPLYRFDAFDCQTYVETVLALALSDSASHFKRCMQNIRYAHGNIEYTQRNHFTSPDWNTFNQQQGMLQDITTTIQDQNQNANARYAETIIHQANWYQHFKVDKIRLCSASSTETKQRLHRLQHLAKFLPAKTSRIAYLPIEALITKDKNSQYLLDQIPSGAIIEIVRPNWDLTKAIGTHLNVSHIGLAIREQGELYFYNASSLTGKVYKPTLVDYLISMRSQPTVQGINIQIVLPTNMCRFAN